MLVCIMAGMTDTADAGFVAGVAAELVVRADAVLVRSVHDPAAASALELGQLYRCGFHTCTVTK